MRIAVLGAGEMGTAHARIYAGPLKDEVELASVFSRRPKKAQRLAKEVGTRPTTHIDEILSDDTIDAVDVCIPSAFHRTIVSRALESRSQVLVNRVADVFLQRVGRIPVQRAKPLKGVADVQLDGDALRHRSVVG